MELSITWHPFRQDLLDAFSAPDPWHDEQPAQWVVAHYLLSDPDLPPAEGATPAPAAHARAAIGIARLDTDEYHMLPTALGRLWLRQRLRKEALPALVHRLERGLPLRYYASWWRKGLQALAWLYGVIGLLLFAIGLALWWRSGPGDFAWGMLGAGAVFQLLGPLQWLRVRLRERHWERTLPAG